MYFYFIINSHSILNPIDQYIFKLDEPYQSIAMYLRSVIKKTLPDIEEKYKWSCPFYDYNGKYMCYINFRKNTKVIDLSFIQGIHLGAFQEVLIDGENRKMIRSLKFKTLEEIDEKLVQEILIAAAEIR